MTREEFDRQEWRKGMMAQFGLLTYEIVSVDFDEYKLLLWDLNQMGDRVKCEYVKLIP